MDNTCDVLQITMGFAYTVIAFYYKYVPDFSVYFLLFLDEYQMMTVDIIFKILSEFFCATPYKNFWFRP